MPRKHAPRFLAFGARSGNSGHGYLTQPQREVPLEPAPDDHAAREDVAREAARVAERTSLCDEPELPGPAIIDAQVDLAKTFDCLRHAANVERAQQERQTLAESLAARLFEEAKELGQDLDARTVTRSAELYAMEARMADIRRRARLRHIDVSHELHLAQRDLDRARRGGRTVPTTVRERVTALEARLDHRPDLIDAA